MNGQWLMAMTVLVLFFGGTVAFSAAVYPTSQDIPQGPVVPVDLGGGGLPVVLGVAAEEAPAIAAISEVTFPDETLVITGYNLAGATLYIWAENQLREVQPLRTTNDRMQVVVPKDLPLSTMLVWPVKDEQVGAPIRVNAPVPWWVWPGEVKAKEAGQSIRIFGKNLTLGTAVPRVYLCGPGMMMELEVIHSRSNPYHLEATLPEGVESGTYQVWVHNGTGGEYGWGTPLELSVIDAPSNQDLPVFHVNDFGAVPGDGEDDWQAISKAIGAAVQAGGGIVEFSPGEYHVTRPIRLAGSTHGGVHLQGAGMGRYTPENHGVSPDATVIRGVFHNGRFPEEIIGVYAQNCSVKGMTLINGNDGRAQRTISLQGKNTVVEGIRAVLIDERDRVADSISFPPPT